MCHDADCDYLECHLSVIMLYVYMLSVISLSLCNVFNALDLHYRLRRSQGSLPVEWNSTSQLQKLHSIGVADGGRQVHFFILRRGYSG